MMTISPATPSTRITIVALLVFVACIASLSALHAQSSNAEIKSYIQKLESGETEAVKNALPDLISKYQNTSDILYLQGRLAADGIEAARFYQGVVDNFPKSEWADDALYRLYQYYSALGLHRTAGLKLDQLKKQYPNSIHVTGRAAVHLPEQEETALILPKKDTIAAEAPSSAAPSGSITDSASVAASPMKPARDSSVEAPAPVTPASGTASTDAGRVKPTSGAGTADAGRVRSTPGTPNADAVPAGSYTLQVGAFSTLANAEKQKGFFEDRGYTAEITNKVRSGRSLHLVWVGSFRSPQEALRTGKEVKAKFKMESIVVERY